MQRGSNLPAVGTYNQTLILDLIRREPEGLSRVELSARTGLSAQTLSNVTRRLVEDGFVVEAGKVRSGPGKPRTILQLNPASRYALGVHLDPAVTTLVVIDLAGSIIHHVQRRPLTSGQAHEHIRDLADGALALVERAGIAPGRLLGIGLAAPGPLDTVSGSILTPPLLPQWHGVAARDDLAAATGLPVVLDKDVIAAMVGELWVAPPDELSNAMFLYYGAGVGAGLAVMGTAVRGATSNAGNIAHLVVDPAGPLCTCGTRGCLGVSIEPGWLLSESAGGSVRETDPEPAMESLRTLALAGHDGALRTLATAGRRMARAISEIHNVLDLDTAVVGGPAWSQLGTWMFPDLEKALRTDPVNTSVNRLVLRDSRLGTDAAAVGAACLLLDGAFTARAADLMITA